jgi:hypothetical protein
VGAVKLPIRAVLGAALLSAALASPGSALADEGMARFGNPTATATWGAGVEFAQPVVLSRDARRVELVLTSPFDPFGSVVIPVEATRAGSTTLRRTVAEGDLPLRPNTTLRGAWRIVFADGLTVEGPPVSVTYRDTRFTWRTLTGSTVRVHWYRGDDAFGKRALGIGEEAVARIGKLLGVAEREPVDFFIYSEENAFYDALGPGTRENVGGQANPEIRTLFALITPAEIDARWVATVIPHELSHLVFDTAVANPYHEPPTWLNEGLAVYLAQGYEADDRSQVRAAVESASLMPLSALTGMFPTTRARFSLAYAESVSAIDHLVRTHGTAALVTLVRAYADGVSDDEAFTRALGIDVATFEAAWLAELGAPTPERYGPRPAAPGPLPAAWTGGAASDGSAGGIVPSGDGSADSPGAPDAQPPVEPVAIAALAIALLIAIGLRRRRARRGSEPA